MSSSGSHTIYQFPGDSDGKASACQCRRPWFDPWVRKIFWGRKWQRSQYPCLENPRQNGQRNLAGYSPWGRKESDTTEQLNIHTIHSLLNWLLSLSNMCLKFLHVFSWLHSPFSFMAEWRFIVWMYHSWFIHSPSGGHLGYFHILAMMSKATVHVHVQAVV